MTILAQGHARPAKALFTSAWITLFGLSLLWLGSLSDWKDWQDFFLWFILSLMGALGVAVGIYIAVEAIRGFPKVFLSDG